jgi:hypothetical protein
VVEVLSSIVVAVLLTQGRDQTCRVASVGRGLAIADLSPQVLAALTAAATEEEVVVDLVVGGRLGAVEHGGRCALQADDNRRVLRVGEDVPSQSVRLPPKVFCVIEASTHVFPLACVGL